MKDYYKVGNSIKNQLRALGYNITMKIRLSWVTYYIDGDFLFCTDLQILSPETTKEIILEILKEKSNVYPHSKN